jgi:hypothetical protein
VELSGYQCHVFLDWRFVNGDQWGEVYRALGGAGIPSVQAKFDEFFAPKSEVKAASTKKKTKIRKVSEKTTRIKPANKKPGKKATTKVGKGGSDKKNSS